MAERPYTVVSCCTSLDGYLDDGSDTRLVLSGAADLDRVDEVRSHCDAILVGAQTLRADNPRLLVRSAARRARRVAEGRAADPVKVTVTRHGDLDPTAAFFTIGSGDRLVYASRDSAGALASRLAEVATVVDAGAEPSMRWVAEDLHARGVRRLLVEGGGSVQGQLLAEDLAGENSTWSSRQRWWGTPGLLGSPALACCSGCREPVTLVTVQRIDECVLLRRTPCPSAIRPSRRTPSRLPPAPRPQATRCTPCPPLSSRPPEPRRPPS